MLHFHNHLFSPHFCIVEKVTILTGAGISAESGIKTFRDAGGLWEEHDINDVATPQGFAKNPELVLNFYNLRRKQVVDAKPNAAHQALVKLASAYEVTIITQNIDDLHERAGSENVMHLHGEIMKSRSTGFENLVYPVKNNEINLGDLCEKGFQLRPDIVWFGEMVPVMENATYIVSQCDILIVIGTSLDVYPAAGLVDYAPINARKFLVDPKAKKLAHLSNLEIIEKKAGDGVPELVNRLMKRKNV